MKIKLLIITTGLARGGAEMMLLKILQRLDLERFDPHVLSLTNNLTLRESFEKIPVPVTVLPVEGLFQIPRFLMKFAQFVRLVQPDLIQGWMYHGNVFASLARCFCPKAKLFFGIRVCLYDFSYERLRTRLIIRLGALLSRGADKVLYVAETARVQHEAIGYNPKNPVVLPNGFDVKSFKPDTKARTTQRQALGIGEDRMLIGYLARYHKMKGFPILFKAIPPILERYPQVVFVLAGKDVDSQGRDWVRGLQTKGLGGRVILLGEVADMPQFLPALDMFVSPSLQEGFPNVVGEAMACGVPCVVTDVGDSALVLGKTGIVVPPNDLEALVEGISSLLDDTKDLPKLATAARDRIQQHFHMDQVVKDYERTWTV